MSLDKKISLTLPCQTKTNFFQPKCPDSGFFLKRTFECLYRRYLNIQRSNNRIIMWIVTVFMISNMLFQIPAQLQLDDHMRCRYPQFPNTSYPCHKYRLLLPITMRSEQRLCYLPV
jgi:hypothetical protein